MKDMTPYYELSKSNGQLPTESSASGGGGNSSNSSDSSSRSDA